MKIYCIKFNNYNSSTEAPFIADSRFGMVIHNLIKKGFVFSSDRLKNLESIAIRYTGWWVWNSIVIGDDECKRVLHAGEDYYFKPSEMPVKYISINSFLRLKNYE